MTTIRPYQHKDFDVISSWWKHYNETSPSIGMMIENGTFVLEINKVPALCLTVFLTQSKEIAYLEGFIKNPIFNYSLHDQSQLLWNHCFQYIKSLGYSRVICYCKVDKLNKKYERLGMSKVAEKLSGYIKEL